MSRLFVLIFVVLLCGFAPLSESYAQEPKTFEMESILNVAYYSGPGADPVRHRLDIYLPKGHKDFPVVFFIHGGAWIEGDKNQFGVYRALAKALTRHGIGVISTNYRLSPFVKHPEHIQDVARAFAWTYRNIGKHGGKPTELFVSGHSAGGHLAALLGTDESYLKAEGLSLDMIRGVMPISGVYIIPDDNIFDIAFANNRTARQKASPISHARRDAPPFLIVYATREFPFCGKECAEAFCASLKGQGARAQTFELSRRNHLTIILNAISDRDPVFQAMLSFVVSQVAMDRLAQGGAAGIYFLEEMIGRYASGGNGR